MTAIPRGTDLPAPPKALAIAAALLAGAIIATVAVGRQPAPVRTISQRAERMTPAESRVHRLLKAVDQKTKGLEEVPGERSELPLRTAIVVSAPRVAATVPLSGIWSADKERWREDWRRWWAQEMARRQ